MPLKKPTVVPKIPKTREKSLDKLKSATPLDKAGETEYKCKVYFYYSTHQKKQQYCFLIETVKQFSVLNYELKLNSKTNKKEIDISIVGLAANQTYLTESGPAVGEVCFDDLYGEKIINIIKQDGTINSAVFSFNIFKKEIVLLKEFLPKKKNNRKFCSFEVASNYFTFGN